MDDIEDDARYPPNLYPPNPRRSFSKLPAPFPRPIGRNYADVDDGEDDNDGQNDVDRATDEPEEEEEEEDDDDEDEYADGYRRIRNDDGGSSSESRGKRRRLDKYALGFEFAPRAAAAAAKPPPPAPTRNSPADWSEDSTFVLLDAWGDLYLQNGRKSIRSDQWSEVAKKVAQSSKTTHSDAQCRNRLDTLKKKYRKEKARMAEDGNSNSKWVYFQKMDALMLAPSPPPPPPPAMRQQQQLQHPLRLPCGVDAGEYVFACSSASLKRSNGVDEMRDSPGDTESEDDDKEDGDDSDDPPLRRENLPGSSELSFRMLADSIQKFGDIYEKIENSKRQQMAELERMRKEFHRDLEVQRMQILERAQAEIAKIRQEEGEEDEEQEERSEENDEEDDGINASN